MTQNLDQDPLQDREIQEVAVLISLIKLDVDDQPEPLHLSVDKTLKKSLGTGRPEDDPFSVAHDVVISAYSPDYFPEYVLSLPIY